MMADNEEAKLKLLLGHWIEHNREHAGEFRKWADRVGQAGAADRIKQAAQAMDDSVKHLSAALKNLGEE